MAAGGVDAETFFKTPFIGFELDDVVALPKQAACSAEEMDLSTQFSKNVRISNPVVSAPIATVTEGRMALACALAGGIGIIHSALDPDAQAREVLLVKQYEQGFVMNPQVLSPEHTIADLDRLQAISGCGSALICEGGMLGTKLVGIVTARDVDFVVDRLMKLKEVMIPKKKMQFVFEPISLSQAQEELRARKVGKLPIVNESGELIAIVTRSDLKKGKAYPFASRDTNHQLMVAAAVSLQKLEGDRIRKLVEAGVDVIVIDSTQGDTLVQVDFIKRTKREFPTIDVVAGNVLTPRQAKPLLDAGADGLRVGVGSFLLYSPLDVCAIGRPLASAIYHVARFARDTYHVPVLAEGAITTSSQVSMALTLGASAVICGSLLAGTREAPGECFYHGGMKLKAYGGIPQLALPPLPPPEARDLKRNSLKSKASPNGGRPSILACSVVEKGSAETVLNLLVDGVMRDLCRLGVSSVPQLHEELLSKLTRLQMRSPAALGAPGYRGG